MISRTPFFWRVFLSFAFLICLSMTVAGFLARSHVSEKYNLQSESEVFRLLSMYAGQARDILVQQSYLSGDDLSFGQEDPGYIRFSLFNASQVLVQDSATDFTGRNNPIFRQEISDAGRRGTGAAERYEPVLEKWFRFNAVRILDSDGNILGYLRGGYDRDYLDAQIEDARSQLGGQMLIATLIILGLAAGVAVSISEPIKKITRLAETVAEGDYNQRVQENQVGLGNLANAINQLARKSADRVADVTTDRNRLAAIFAGMVEGVIGVDRNMFIQHVNDAAARILQLDSSRALKKPLWEEVRIETIIKAIDQAIKGGEVIKTQMRLPRERDELVVDIYAASLSNEAGEALGAVLVLHDITELESLSRIRTDFVANASHELKTPITAIRGLAETILSDKDISEEDLNRFLDRIYAQSLRLSQLVSDLMTISRLESVQYEQEFLQVNLATLVRKAVQSLKATAESKNQKLVSTISQEPINVSGDRQHLTQLIDNLIDNAVKYTQDGGTIQVTLEKSDEYATLTVEDNGIGISQQYQKRIFERFYRVDKVRSQSLGGTGLGLSIVKNIVDKHFGVIVLKSQPGVGSIFTVKLPLSSDYHQPDMSQAS